MSLERQSFEANSTPEIYGVERLQVTLRPAENKAYSYVSIDAGEGIKFETVVKNDTGEIVDRIDLTTLLRRELIATAQNLRNLVPEAIQLHLDNSQSQNQGQASSEFWSQSEEERLAEAIKLADDRNDQLVD